MVEKGHTVAGGGLWPVSGGNRRRMDNDNGGKMDGSGGNPTPTSAWSAGGVWWGVGERRRGIGFGWG